MDIQSIKIFKIDFHKTHADIIDKDSLGIDFNEYLKVLIELIISGNTGRSFHFDTDTTEVRSQIKRILSNDDFLSISETIANRLLKTEKNTQLKIAKLGTEIQKGIFVQAIVVQDNIQKFIICKAENIDFLNELNFELTRGLPIKKKVLKGFVCSLNHNSVSDIIVYDPQLSTYWWNDFLELTKVHSDEDNTQNAFDAIDKTILRNLLKNKYPQDYMHLSNSNVRYFRANENFDMDKYIDDIFANYLPFDKNLNIDDIIKKVRELPQKSRKVFDEQFSIKRNLIKKRIIKEIPLTDDISLHFKQDIPNLESVVTAYEGPDGVRYVRIKSEHGFQYFNKLKEDKI